MLTSEILSELSLGQSIAETDERLDRYFVNTHTFHALIRGEKDIIAGDKGTGKTALYRILMKRSRQTEELRNTRVVPAFNLTGNPIFQELIQIPEQTEGQYIAFWKTYFLSLVGNWLLDQRDIVQQSSIKRIELFLQRSNLKNIDTTPKSIFSKLVAFFPRGPLKNIEMELGMSESGLPTAKPKLEFGDAAVVQPMTFFGVDYFAGLKLLEASLKESNLTVWIALDRLDEAFQGFPHIEVPALRALLRAYLDLREISNLSLKLFIRKDLFRKVIANGFVNLTHVNARKIEIVWQDEDLKHLLIARVKDNDSVVKNLNIWGVSNDVAFATLFPNKVSPGEKQSTTWNWMMSRIKDGNAVIAPRNLIDLVEKARADQVQCDYRSPREFTGSIPLIEADSVKRAHKLLSKDRVEDTLFAESAELAPLLESFRNKKTEYDVASIAILLSVEEEEARKSIRKLREIGFLEEVGKYYKIPMLYREGLGVRQGKATGTEAEFETEEQEDDDEQVEIRSFDGD